jgi:hypothetical protein
LCPRQPSATMGMRYSVVCSPFSNDQDRGAPPSPVPWTATPSAAILAATSVHLGMDELAPCAPDRIFDSSVDRFPHGLSVTHEARHDNTS